VFFTKSAVNFTGAITASCVLFRVFAVFANFSAVLVNHTLSATFEVHFKAHFQSANQL
jgi:lipoprotein